MPDADSDEFDIKIESDDIEAPFEKGTKAGNLVIYQDSKPIAQFEVFAAELSLIHI